MEASVAPRPLVKRHHGLVRLAHWLNAIVLLGMIASGLQIYAAFSHFGPRRRAVPEPVRRQVAAPVVAAGRLARRRAQLALRAGLALRDHRARLSRLSRLVRANGGRCCSAPATSAPPSRCSSTTCGSGPTHPPQGKHNALQKGAYTFIVLLGAISALSGFAIYKPVQLAWLTSLFGGYELARYWHFWAVWIFVGFTLLHVALVFLVDPASLRAMITGWYRGRFPSHE